MKDKKKKAPIVVLIIVVVMIVAAVLAIGSMRKTAISTSNAIEVGEVKRRDLSDTISLRGTVSGQRRMNVISLAEAEVTAVNVQVGDVVTEGQTLITLDQADVEKKIAELEKSISNSGVLETYSQKDLQNALKQAELSQTQTLEDAKKAIDQATAAYESAKSEIVAGFIAQQNEATTPEQKAAIEQQTMDWINVGHHADSRLSAAKQAIEDARKAYDRAVLSTNQAVSDAKEAIEKAKYTGDNTVKTSKDSLENLKKQLKDCDLKAPCSGVVTAVSVSVGDKNTVGTALVTIEDTSSLKMVANVDEKDILKLDEGMKATLVSDATSDKEITGTVSRVVRVKGQSSGGTSSMSSMSSSAGGYSVEVSMDTTDLLIGMSVKAKIVLRDKANRLAVPYDLVQYDNAGNAFVYVANRKGADSAVAEKRQIEVGEEINYYTEVLGGDLKEGDLLIYDYNQSVTEGMTFTPAQVFDASGAEGSDGNNTEAEEM
ncbi:MAG: efflux RND transporter periplasmic adaptor subunit [Roseburia sp.]